MTPEEVAAAERLELAYVRGQRSVWVNLLRTACRELGYDSPEAAQVKYLAEREEAIATLRECCDDYGDQDWEESLHLSDIIDKHLVRPIRARLDE